MLAHILNHKFLVEAGYALKTLVGFALAGVVQWIEHRPANQRVASSIPNQGTSLGCRPGPQ